jgi:hypothetical protein
MKYPEILLLPILMFSDYLLTVLGATQKERKYSEHFKTQHYELNPIWQKAISQKKWLNPRHSLLTILLSGILACLLELGVLPEPFVQGLLGCLFVFFGMAIGRHLSNILIFRRFAQCPEGISGQITMTHSLSLSISMYQYLVAAVPLAILAFFNPTPFVFGGLAGAGMIFMVHSIWIHRHQKKAPGNT